MAELLSEQQLAALRSSLRRHGHARFPLLRAEIEDLAAQAVADLWQYLRERERDCGPTLGVEAIQRIAYAIFNRRAADLYRKSRSEPRAGADRQPPEEAPDGRTGDFVTTELYRSMLRVCVAELAGVAEEDQMALAIATGLASSQGEAMTPAERQRLHRVRKRLAAAIQRELGDDAYRLLRAVS
jgi:hypothetical protein